MAQVSLLGLGGFVATQPSSRLIANAPHAGSVQSSVTTLRCLECGYEVGTLTDGPAVDVCPECGTRVTSYTAHVAAMHAQLRERLSLQRHVMLWIGICVVYPIGAAVLAVLAFDRSSFSVLVTAAKAFGLIAASLACSFIAGSGLVLAYARWERHVVATLWLRWQMRLQLPWLVAIAFVVVGLSEGVLVNIRPPSEAFDVMVLSVTNLGLACLWALGCIVLTGRSIDGWYDLERTYGLVGRSLGFPPPTLMVLLAVGASSVVGFLACAFAVMTTYTLVTGQTLI